jgi:exodeoxyribonuclease VII small subunit
MRPKKNTADANPPEAEKPGFEESLRRLEEVVSELEQGNLPLDKALKLYEEGVQAYRACHEILQNAECKVAKLVETLEGTLKEQPFEPTEEQ